VDGLTFSRTVPREIVHRASVAEVFVTSLADLGADRFDVGVQLPRSHGFYGDNDQLHHDPLAFVEAGRQACLALSHQYFRAPADARFVLRRFAFRVHDRDGLEITATPCEAALRCQVVRHFAQHGQPNGLHLRYRVEVGGRHAMTAEFDFSWLSDKAWATLRGAVPHPRTAPPAARCPATVVGRHRERNVVIGPPQFDGRFARAELLVDTDHPTLFDHPVDHVPGMVLVEAVRQLATASTAVSASLRSGMPIALRCQFNAFAELAPVAVCHSQLGAVHSVEAGRQLDAWCWINQSGRIVTEAELRLAFADETVGMTDVNHLSGRVC
jgi:2-oxo-3-(phosphooxy)propyl 3-oxoalkanoate synthase